MTTTIHRIALVEDHILQRRRTEELIAQQGDLELVFSGETSADLVAWLRGCSTEGYPHLVVLDLLAERRAGVEPELVVALIASGIRVLVLSAMASPPLVREIVRAGVHGVVGKRDSEDDIVAGIRAVLEGRSWMTEELAVVIAGDPSRPKLSIQEERSLILFASGMTVPEVAEAMNVKPATAKQYLDRVKAKYTAAGVPTRSKLDLSRIAWADGYVRPTLPGE